MGTDHTLNTEGEQDRKTASIRRQSGGGKRLRLILLILVVLVLALIVFLLMRGNATSGPSLETIVAEQQQAIASLTEQVSAHDEALERSRQGESDQTARIDSLNQDISDMSARMSVLDDELTQVSDELVTSDSLTERAAALELRIQANTEQQSALEARLEEVREATVSNRSASRARAEPPGTASRGAVEVIRTPTPPFDLLGIEQRGGRPYLAVANSGVSGIGDIRLLSAGESMGQWRLVALDSDGMATFVVAGDNVRVPVQ